jgi:hypothetical protein
MRRRKNKEKNGGMMKDLPVEKRNLQADVYLALATVIQAITLTGLGTEVVSILKDPQKPVTIWVILTGLLSLQFCISFWFLFVRDYFFGYRLINLTAQNHMVAASFIFILGFLQFIAFQFLADPRLWLTLVLAGVWLVLLHAWYTTGNIKIVEAEGGARGHRHGSGLEPVHTAGAGCNGLFGLVVRRAGYRRGLVQDHRAGADGGGAGVAGFVRHRGLPKAPGCWVVRTISNLGALEVSTTENYSLQGKEKNHKVHRDEHQEHKGKTFVPLVFIFLVSFVVNNN